MRFSIFSLLLLSFTGDFDADNYPTHVDQALLVTYLLVTVIVQLNILIAIVSDSYDAARASGKALYYRAHLSLVSETANIASRCIPRRLLPTIDEAWIAKCLLTALAEREEDRGRIVEITRRTRAAVDADTRRALARNNAELREMMRQLLANASIPNPPSESVN